LGSGSGSNLHFLAPRLPGHQRWRLIDHDAHLLTQATDRFHSLRDGDGNPIELVSDCRDLADLNAAPLEGSDLICASALFDLVSHDWLERLADACVACDAGVLFTLSVNGQWSFIDRHGQACNDAEDRWVHQLIIAHQQRDKGFGAALGGGAPAALSEAFAQRGYTVVSAPSPWCLPPGHTESITLGHALLDGWLQAAREQAPCSGQRLAAWLDNRRMALANATLGLKIGHDDVFAYPSAHCQAN
ncbi:MAG TPA: class I SAM-dependent methyltransferase, partial [Modicisalibacter sp.]|nr:class I SAM-dependent methyltransferase [Modicisalibacter sp.]